MRGPGKAKRARISRCKVWLAKGRSRAWMEREIQREGKVRSDRAIRDTVIDAELERAEELRALAAEAEGLTADQAQSALDEYLDEQDKIVSRGWDLSDRSPGYLGAMGAASERKAAARGVSTRRETHEQRISGGLVVATASWGEFLRLLEQANRLAADYVEEDF